MDMKKSLSRLTMIVKKYKYAVLILVFGLLLMLLPIPSRDSQTQDASPVPENTARFSDITEELTQMLSQIDGVGKVRVMLTISEGEQTIYQYDEDITTSDTGSSIRKETVTVTGTDRVEQPLISYVRPPVYLGAIIVCQGADQASVKLNVIDAVSKITGLSSDKISVVKMK